MMPAPCGPAGGQSAALNSRLAAGGWAAQQAEAGRTAGVCKAAVALLLPGAQGQVEACADFCSTGCL